MEADQSSVTIAFADNRLLAQLVGEYDQNLAQIEQALKLRLSCRGNKILIQGNEEERHIAQTVLSYLYNRIEEQGSISSDEISASLRLLSPSSKKRYDRMPLSSSSASASHQPLADLPEIKTKRGVISPRSSGQAQYMDLLNKKQMIFGIGPAGTGKTFLAVAQAVAMLQAGQVDRIILSRPAVEAGEHLGFLPGDMKEKIDPYLRPLYDALHAMLPGDQLGRRMSSGEIEVAPLAFMRGRTLAHAFVILDEAQNTTPAQMKMFLTRMGSGTRMVITGDLSQIDLPPNTVSGLNDAVKTLEGIEDIAVLRFTSADVVRHPLVAQIVDAYDGKVKPATTDASKRISKRRIPATSTH